MTLATDDFRSFENQMHGWAELPSQVQPDWTASTTEVVEFGSALSFPASVWGALASAFNIDIQDLRDLFDSLGRLGSGGATRLGDDNLDDEIAIRGSIFDAIGRYQGTITELLAYLQQYYPFQLRRLWIILAAWKRLTGSTLGLADLLEQLRALIAPIRNPPPLADPGKIIGPAGQAIAAIVGAIQGLVGGVGQTVGGLLQIYAQQLSVNQISSSGLGSGSSITLLPNGGSSPAGVPTVGRFQLQVTPGPGAAKPQTITVNLNIPPDLLAAWKAQPMAYVTVFDNTTGAALNVQGTVTWTDSGFTVTFDNPSSISPVLQNGHTYTLTFFFIS